MTRRVEQVALLGCLVVSLGISSIAGADTLWGVILLDQEGYPCLGESVFVWPNPYASSIFLRRLVQFNSGPQGQVLSYVYIDASRTLGFASGTGETQTVYAPDFIPLGVGQSITIHYGCSGGASLVGTSIVILYYTLTLPPT